MGIVRFSSALSEVWGLAISVVVLGLFSQAVSAQQNDNQPVRTIYPCNIKIKAKGAEFSYTYSYWVTADGTGKIAKVTPFQSDGRKAASGFVDEGNFISCVKKWTLEQNGKYIVQFRVATMSDGSGKEPRNYVMILGPGDSGQKLKMELPWSVEDILIVPENPANPTKTKAKD